MPPTRWTCRRVADLVLRDWPDGSVLFDEASGQLRCLNPSAGMVMRLFLEKREWRAGELAEALFDAPPSAEDIGLVDGVLLHFLQLKLIERLPD